MRIASRNAPFQMTFTGLLPMSPLQLYSQIAPTSAQRTTPQSNAHHTDPHRIPPHGASCHIHFTHAHPTPMPHPTTRHMPLATRHSPLATSSHATADARWEGSLSRFINAQPARADMYCGRDAKRGGGAYLQYLLSIDMFRVTHHVAMPALTCAMCPMWRCLPLLAPCAPPCGDDCHLLAPCARCGDDCHYLHHVPHVAMTAITCAMFPTLWRCPFRSRR